MTQTDSNAHARGVIAQLRQNERDEELPKSLRDRSGDRADELEADLAATDADLATVYLAGPIAAVEDGGASWRSELQEFYGDDYAFNDPLAKYGVPARELDVVDGWSNQSNPETVGVDELVERDKALIDDADGLLVGYTDVRSTGTPMEIMYARERDMPVAIWVRDDTDFDDLSPWYRYHATALTTDPEMGLRHIERQAFGEAEDGE